MEYDNYLGFFHRAVLSKQLHEKTTIQKFIDENEVPHYQLIRKKTKVLKAIIGVNLSKNLKLLVEDYPINFLISHTLLVGDKSQIYEFSFKKTTFETDNEDMKYLATKSVMNKFDNIDKSSIKEINSKGLFRKKFTFDFEQPLIINDIKKYIKDKKGLDMNSIHIVKSRSVENFLPTIKQQDLKIARDMNIPVIPLVAKNYIKHSNININDELMHIEIINPIYKYEFEEDRYYSKKNMKSAYLDVSTDYYIRVLNKELIEKIKTAENCAIKKDKLISSIEGINTLRLSSSSGTYPIPLWKTHKNQNFVEIKNSNHFETITGMKFKLKSELFSDLFITNRDGAKGLFKNKYLKSNLEHTFETMSFEGNIEFNSPIEFILKASFVPEIKYLNKYKHKHISTPNELSNIIDSSIKILIQKEIETSSSEKKLKKELNSFFENALENIINIFSERKILINKYPFAELLNDIIQTLNSVRIIFLKHENFSEESISLFRDLISLSNKILKIFDLENSNSFKNILESYFKHYQISIDKSKNDKNFETLIRDISKSLKLKNKNSQTIIFKKELDTNLLNHTHISKDLPSFKTYIKPDYEKLKQVFPYRYNQIAIQISALEKEELGKASLNINQKHIPVDPSFYYELKVYKGYKTIINNPYFTILISKGGNQKSRAKFN